MLAGFPPRGGTCGELIRSIDWSTSPVGPVESWPTSLRVTLQTVLNSRHPMFVWWGPELVQFYNDAYVPSFGHGKHPAAMGQRGAECWSEIWPIIGPQIEGVMTRGESTWHQDALVPILRNGRIEEVYWTYGYSPVFDEDDRIHGTLVVCTETTGRVIATRHQRLLRQISERASSVARPQVLIETAFAAFADDPEDIPCAAWLDATCSITRASVGGGFDIGELRDVIGPRMPLAAPEVVRLRRPMATGPWPAPVREVFVLPALGGLVVFGLSGYLPFDDTYRVFLVQLVEAIAMAHERSEALSVRATAEAERRDLLLQAPIATALLTGPDLVHELANPQYVEMVGREVAGKKYFDAFPEFVGTPLATIISDVYRLGVPHVSRELRLALDRRGDGTMEDAYFTFTLQPIRDADGTVYGMMVMALDITDLVRARDERLALLTQLEAANRTKDEFLALLGHELRNPLSPIVTALELIAAGGPDPAAREHEVIRRQVSHLSRLVDDLLDVSRIVGGKIELRRETVAIGDVVRQALEISADLAEARGHRLEVTIPTAPIMWWGDPVRLAQIVANLLTNAARYTEPGGQIHLGVSRAGGGLEISVTDNGIGISAELLPRIFERFVQGPRSTNGSNSGLGIGLALVRSLVELHGGSVTAASAGPGCGSRFVISLPIEAAPAPAEPPRAAPHSPATGKRVLLVDDNVDAADMLAELLRMRGHHVEVAHDAAAALAATTMFKPQVALLDIGLPVIDGYQLAARLLSEASAPPPLLIALTGYGQDGDRRRAHSVGFSVHLVKPVKLDALLDAIALA
jgi:signal transduction histidine kinase/CheY-like chemotaxis protein